MKAAILACLAAAAVAQDQTGRIEGVVLDSASHQPVKKAQVQLLGGQMTPGQTSPPGTTTDLTGKFSFSSLPAGQYSLNVSHPNYPQARFGGVRKTVRISAGESAAPLTIELIPGASLSGHILDEDGDPLANCTVQLHPWKNPNQGVQMSGLQQGRDDGAYRLYDIAPGNYYVTAQCATPVFQPRPLSDGPDPPPSSAYAPQYYPSASDLKSAQPVELLPGSEKAGIDFQMRPTPVTHVHGQLVAGSGDWHGRTNLQVQLLPAEGRAAGPFAFGVGGQVNAKDGSFDFRQVFPGSYRLVMFSRPNITPGTGQVDMSDSIGAIAKVEVGDKPVELSIPVSRAMDLTGTVVIERGNNTTNPLALSQIYLQLMAENQFGGPPGPSKINDDGTFVFKGVLPGEWRLRMVQQNAFIKSAWMGSENVTDKAMDLTSGAATPLRIVVSTNTATVRGTAPSGHMVFSARLDTGTTSIGFNATQVDQSGQFTMGGFAPGKYRLVLGENAGLIPDEGGQEVEVHEGETLMVELKSSSN